MYVRVGQNGENSSCSYQCGAIARGKTANVHIHVHVHVYHNTACKLHYSTCVQSYNSQVLSLVVTPFSGHMYTQQHCIQEDKNSEKYAEESEKELVKKIMHSVPKSSPHRILISHIHVHVNLCMYMYIYTCNCRRCTCTLFIVLSYYKCILYMYNVCIFVHMYVFIIQTFQIMGIGNVSLTDWSKVSV